MERLMTSIGEAVATEVEEIVNVTYSREDSYKLILRTIEDEKYELELKKVE